MARAWVLKLKACRDKARVSAKAVVKGWAWGCRHLVRKTVVRVLALDKSLVKVKA